MITNIIFSATAAQLEALHADDIQRRLTDANERTESETHANT
ncbi:MAG: hypothetical protein ACYCUI_13635 [Vulcanimicrobiaceae bacterium]